MMEKESVNIIMGDFNAKIGKSEAINLGVGPEVSGTSNKNGIESINFCNRHNLKIAHILL